MKRIMLVLSLAFMLACVTLVPTPTPIPTVTEPPTRTSTPEATEVIPAVTVTLTLTPKPTGFTKVRILTNDGTLEDQLAAEAQKAAALGQMPVVEFDASW